MLPNKEEEKSWYKVKVGFKFYEISDNSYLEYRIIVYIQLYIVWFYGTLGRLEVVGRNKRKAF